tara:strand:+ start:1572 stop:3287 length:1716 start_codon:yes stop_codon:yes gene_type:complete
MFSIYYKKNKNIELFKGFENNGIYNTQNYIPLYKKYFTLNNTNYNSINLNHKFSINLIKNKIDNNKFNVKIIDSSNNSLNTKSFFKFSPLLDPVKYMMGKYEKFDISLLPKLEDSTCHEKLLDNNNTAYVDSFFSYLSSKLLNNYNFLNGLDFYGSFVGMQKDFVVNVVDELDYIYPADYFHKNKNKLFKLEDFDIDLLEIETRKYRKRLEMNDEVVDIKTDKLDEYLTTDDIFELTENNLKLHNDENSELVYEKGGNNKEENEESQSEGCSSRSSNTDDEKEDEEEEDKEEDNKESLNSCTNSNLSGYSTVSSEEHVIANVYNFPVQIICMESLDNTLDSLLDDEETDLNIKEWKSCLFQVIMSLIIYQKCFDFTHNDLHTNNIMYLETKKQYLYYRFDGVLYKVPTYGKIYKIIDFGRSIYKFKGNLMCSDSYHPKGDAATQYNFEPFFNPNKPRLEPNMSFDLCRLGCSLFDHFVDSIENKNKIKNPIAKLIIKWCTDDKGRNILYKNNGEERYPDFKLYKMIARNVHNNVPSNEIKNKLFNDYVTSKKRVNKKAKILNVDLMNIYVD